MCEEFERNESAARPLMGRDEKDEKMGTTAQKGHRYFFYFQYTSLNLLHGME